MRKIIEGMPLRGKDSEAEGAGFEPAERAFTRSRDFESPAFVRSATPPANIKNYN